MEAETTALVPSLNLETFLKAHGTALDLVTQAAELLQQARDITESIGLERVMESVGPRASRLCSRQADLLESNGIKDFQKFLDSLAWDRILKETGIRTFMDNASRRTWDEQIQRCDVPELNLEAVQQNIRQWYDTRPDMMEAGVLEVFRHLSYDYKSNSHRKFGKKVIVESFCSKWIHRCNGVTTTDLHFAQNTCNYIDDLVRVMHILDHKPEPDHRQGIYRRATAAYTNGQQMTLDTEYLGLRWYLKGTVHVTFKRPELVVQMNQILNKHHPNALPPLR